MHILYLHQHFAPPGSFGNDRSLSFAKEWVRSGHQVTIVCGSGNFKEAIPRWVPYRKYTIEGIDICRLNVGYAHQMGFFKRMLSFLCFLMYALPMVTFIRKVDLVYASSTPLSIGLLALWAHKVRRKMYVFETVDLWPDVPIAMGIIRSKLWIRLSYLLEYHCYRHAKAVIALSEGMAELIIAKGIPSHKVFVVHNGTDTQYFVPSNDKAAMKEKIGYKPHDFIVLYAGTIGLANGLEFLADVAWEIEQCHSFSIHFLILGNGNRANAFRSKIRKLGLTNVKILPSVPKTEVLPYFQAADIGVCLFAPYPILATNSANKFFDYLASGLPVFVNYGGWQAYYLHTFQAGEAEEEAKAFASKLIDALEDPVRCQTWSQNARQLAVQSFDRSALAKLSLEILAKR